VRLRQVIFHKAFRRPTGPPSLPHREDLKTMAKLPARPRKSVALLAIGGGLAFIVVALLLLYFVIFPTSSPKPFTLTSSPDTGTARTNSTATRSPSATKLTGGWKIASGSQAGYRVREKLAFLPAQSDAVGRTSQMTGSATITQAGHSVTITAASFDVAVSTLKSDRSMRDEKIHEIGLESNRYPTAAFVLSTPVTLAKSAVTGRVARVPVTGVFTIHGVAKRETLPVEFSLAGATLETAGSLTFPWGEFGMTAPSVGGFVNVTGTATMEFDLRLQRA
jgi:polyisoprenoid-binding protein YceI